MSHGILIPEAIAATNVDSLNRSVIYASGTLDNGMVVSLSSGKSATSGEGEVWTATVPATGTLADLWMVYSGDEVVLTDSRYKGLDPDPRNFFTAAGKVVSAFKPQVGDIILATADCFLGTMGANTFVNATDTSGGLNLYWGATKTASVLSFKLTRAAAIYISIGTGAIDTQRIAAYEFECVGIN
jgi:hypothetical protein